MAFIQGRCSLDYFQKVFESIHRKIKKCHVNNFFVHGGVKNRPGLIYKTIRVEKLYLMMPTGLRAPEHKLVEIKKIEKLPRIPKIGVRDPPKALDS